MLEKVEFKVEGKNRRKSDRINLKSLVNKGDTIYINLYAPFSIIAKYIRKKAVKNIEIL